MKVRTHNTSGPNIDPRGTIHPDEPAREILSRHLIGKSHETDCHIQFGSLLIKINQYRLREADISKLVL